MSTVVAASSLTPTLGVETTVDAVIQTSGTFQLWVECTALVTTEMLFLRTYRETKDSNTKLLCRTMIFRGDETEELKETLPIAVPDNVSLTFTLQQKIGAARTYHYSIEKL